MKQAISTSTEKIKLAVEATEGYAFTRKQIDQVLPEIPRGTISSVISHLKKDGVLMPTNTQGEYKLINPKKPISLVPNPPPSTEFEEFNIDDMSISEQEEILMHFVTEYVRLKRANSKLKGMLERVFGEAKKAKIIPLCKTEH